MYILVIFNTGIEVVRTCIMNVGVNEVVAVFGNAVIARSPWHLAKDIDQLVTCNLVLGSPSHDRGQVLLT